MLPPVNRTGEGHGLAVVSAVSMLLTCSSERTARKPV